MLILTPTAHAITIGSSAETVSGIALQSSLKAPHKLVNVAYDMTNNLMRLDYSLYCDPVSNKTRKKVIPSNFPDMVANRYENPSFLQQAQSHYRNLLSKFFPGGNPGGFIEEIPARALVASYYFEPDNNFSITQSTLSVTDVVMPKKGIVTLSDSSTLALNDTGSRGFALYNLREFVDSQSKTPAISSDTFIDFQSVGHKTSNMVEEHMADYLLEQYIDVLWRVDNKQKSTKRGARDPVNFASTCTLVEEAKPILQITKASREAAAINRKLIAFFVETREQMFDADTTAAIATMCQDAKLEHLGL